jgi:hypothetical protein
VPCCATACTVGYTTFASASAGLNPMMCRQTHALEIESGATGQELSEAEPILVNLEHNYVMITG